MIFDDLLAGSSLFIDANPLVDYFASDPAFGPTCARLITRIQNQELRAFTSTHVLSEAGHKLMAIEAATQFGWKSKVVQHLKQQPDKVEQLTKFRQAIQQVTQLGIQVVAIAPALVDAGCLVSQQTGLLTNDALVVAVMQAHGLSSLASNDPDFDRVPRHYAVCASVTTPAQDGRMFRMSPMSSVKGFSAINLSRTVAQKNCFAHSSVRPAVPLADCSRRKSRKASVSAGVTSARAFPAPK